MRRSRPTGRAARVVATLVAVAAGILAVDTWLHAVAAPEELVRAPSDSRAGSPLEPSTRLPPDGWYLVLPVPYAGSRDVQLQQGRALLQRVRRLGYAGAGLHPHPGVPASCLGRPCEAVGLPAGMELVVVLEPVTGPDFTSGATTTEVMSAFRTEAIPVVEERASSAGLPADVDWLSFSNIEDGVVWTPPPPGG